MLYIGVVIITPTLASGARKAGDWISDWLSTLRVSEVVFEDAAAFTNINSLGELLIADQAQQ